MYSIPANLFDAVAAVVEIKRRKTTSQRTKEGLAHAKQRGVILGGDRGNCQAIYHKGAQASAKVRREQSEHRAIDLMPTISALKASGVVSLRQIATELNQRRITTARGGVWSAVQVARLVRRINWTCA